jgi:hypothetical protein
MEVNMKALMLMLTYFVLALPAYAATSTHKFSPPTVSKQQEEAYNQTHTADKTREKQLKAGDKTHG